MQAFIGVHWTIYGLLAYARNTVKLSQTTLNEFKLHRKKWSSNTIFSRNPTSTMRLLHTLFLEHMPSWTIPNKRITVKVCWLQPFIIHKEYSKVNIIIRLTNTYWFVGLQESVEHSTDITIMNGSLCLPANDDPTRIWMRSTSLHSTTGDDWNSGFWPHVFEAEHSVNVVVIITRRSHVTSHFC